CSGAAAGERCSPRTWGWSGLHPSTLPSVVVLPTHVGMVRNVGFPHSAHAGAPHARGDGPSSKAEPATPGGCSPRTWGWSGDRRAGRVRRFVLPTHVGMVPGRTGSRESRRGAPHARGDGPRDVHVSSTPHMCSPRTWGWSEVKRR